MDCRLGGQRAAKGDNYGTTYVAGQGADLAPDNKRKMKGMAANILARKRVERAERGGPKQGNSAYSWPCLYSSQDIDSFSKGPFIPSRKVFWPTFG